MCIMYGIKTFGNLYDILLFKVLKSCYGLYWLPKTMKVTPGEKEVIKNYYYPTCAVIFNSEAHLCFYQSKFGKI